MNIGIPKERRHLMSFACRLLPAGVQMLAEEGHTVYVEHDAGLGAAFGDQVF